MAQRFRLKLWSLGVTRNRRLLPGLVITDFNPWVMASNLIERHAYAPFVGSAHITEAHKKCIYHLIQF